MAVSIVPWQILCVSSWHFYYYFLNLLFKAITDILLSKYKSPALLSIDRYDISEMETLYTILFNCQNASLSEILSSLYR